MEKSINQAGIFSSDDAVRQLLQRMIQEILESEMKSYLHAESYERTESRTGYRNGYKPRILHTRVGTLELMVPKDREGRFQTELFERYQRSEKALMLTVAEMYIHGVATRKVKKITEALCGLDISKSHVSELSKRLDDQIKSWRNRPLEKEYVYLIADARYEHIRSGGRVTSHGVLIIIGIDKEGYREPLGVWIADSESETSWTGAFNSLKKRGLSGVKYVVSDNHKGLKKAVHKCFQGVLWQRCQVHFIRNVLKLTSRKNRRYIMSLIREITGSRSLEMARKHIAETVSLLEQTHPKIAELLDEHGEEILAAYHLPESHRKRMRSTNMLERLNQEIKRRTRVVRIFPNEASCIRLISALVMETAEEWMQRKYLTLEEQTEVKIELKDEKAA
ncbi:MAG: IS256 family transposase [Planctomycetes bacterium]|nr:IS256 family transposase [Planctomycetota bacterium]